MRRPSYGPTWIALLGLATSWTLPAVAEEKPAAEKASATAPGEEKPPKATEDVRGPAENVVFEAGVGYGAGTLTAIAGHQPKVVNGVTFHFGLGYAWTIRASQSIGIELSVDGMTDPSRVNQDPKSIGDQGVTVAGRYGAQAFLIGHRGHLRLGAGYARTKFEGGSYDGIGIAFAAGVHWGVLPFDAFKRPMITLEVTPAWDVLGAGQETLHRLSMGLLVGVAVY